LEPDKARQQRCGAQKPDGPQAGFISNLVLFALFPKRRNRWLGRQRPVDLLWCFPAQDR